MRILDRSPFIRGSLVAVLTLFVLGACAPTTSSGSSSAVENPFDAPYDGPIETVALLVDARGTESSTERSMADAALYALLDHPYAYRRYDVVERSRVDAITDELGLTSSGLVDQSTAAEVGQLLGANSVLLMSVSGVSVSPYGLASFNIGVGGSVYDVRATVQMRLVDIESGRIIAAARQNAQQVVPGSFAFRGVGFAGNPEDAALLNVVTSAATVAIDDLMRSIGTR